MKHELCECDISRQLCAELASAKLELDYWRDAARRYKARTTAAVAILEDALELGVPCYRTSINMAINKLLL
jgi:hypothetical protein